jgi:hypothetical protein
MTEGTAPQRSNRRLMARVACHLTVSYKTAKDWHPAMAMDVSRNGGRLRLGEDLATGTAITVRIEHVGGNGSPALQAEVPGHVIWSRLEGLSHQAGVQWSAESDALHAILRTLG